MVFHSIVDVGHIKIHFHFCFWFESALNILWDAVVLFQTAYTFYPCCKPKDLGYFSTVQHVKNQHKLDGKKHGIKKTENSLKILIDNCLVGTKLGLRYSVINYSEL